MKRFISLCIFALALTIGTSSLYAQEKYKKMEENIKIEANELQKVLNLDGDQTALLARSMYAKEKAHAEIDKNTKLDAKEAQALREKVDMNFKSRLQSVLTEEQFAAYSAYKAKKKSKPKY